MTRIRSILLAVAALLAFGAMTAASASALEPAEFKYAETTPPEPNKFTATSGVGTLETANGTEVTCQKDTATGQIKKSGEGVVEKVFVTFKECKSAGKKCNSTEGVETETIKTNELKGELLEKNNDGAVDSQLMLRLEPATSGEPFADFDCGALDVEVFGKVNAGVNSGGLPYNEDTHPSVAAAELKYEKDVGKGEQELDDSPGDSETLSTTFGGGVFEESAIKTVAQVAFTKAVEMLSTP